MKIIVIPDSFKGTIKASEAAAIIAAEAARVYPFAEISEYPIADGGEGTLDCFFKILGGRYIEKEVTGPNFKKITARYLEAGETAVVELAEAAGLPLANPRDPLNTTTYGVGELIGAALSSGAKRVILGMGGSATNDMGAGMAAALGVVFKDKDGRPFIPTGGTLSKIAKIESLKNLNITALCDVKNPLTGENGAAFVYAPQKGADKRAVLTLDDGLKHANDILKNYGIDVSDVEGAGAAGGTGGGVLAFLGGELKRGIDTVLELIGFGKKARTADLIVTGEGSLDRQSFYGKVIDGIISRSGGTTVVAIVGISKIQNHRDFGLAAVVETNYLHRPFEEIKPTAKEDLKAAAAKFFENLPEYLN
ncbi:MAG: glycerate kinase [Christensenellales bacterium]|jgi:glycerate kinase